MFRRQPNDTVIGAINSPYGIVVIEEDQEYFRVKFDDDSCFFISAEGDLLRILFNLRTMNLEEQLRYALWLLSDTEIAAIVNPKFGNKPELRFSAAMFATTDKDKRSCILLPTDTVETAANRFENVWYKQAPIAVYTGKLAEHVE